MSPRSADYVQSLERGLAVIRAFDGEHPALTLSEVSRRTGLSRATARRFLLTLVELGYVHTDGREFSLRPSVLDLGFAYLSSMGLPEVALPHMEALVGGAPGVIVDVRARRRRRHLHRPGADTAADHDGVDRRRHPVPRLRHVDGPGPARPPRRGGARRLPGERRR